MDLLHTGSVLFLKSPVTTKALSLFRIDSVACVSASAKAPFVFSNEREVSSSTQSFVF